MSTTVSRAAYTRACVEFFASLGVRIDAAYPIRLDEDQITWSAPDGSDDVEIEVVEE